MDSLTKVTVIWSMIAAAAVMLGLMHAARWSADRESRADLAFAIVAFCFAGIAYAEIGGMHARTPEEWGQWMRWYHLPLYGLHIGTVAFVRYYLGAGRRWLMWSVVVVRTVILLLNFAMEPNFNFQEISSIRRIEFLGEEVSVVDEAVTGRLQFLGIVSSVLLVAYVLDAAVALWRRRAADDRRRAATIGGSIFFFLLAASINAQLVIWGGAQMPFLFAPAFLVPLFAMAFELSRDLVRAPRLARELVESQQRLELAAVAANLGVWEWDGRTRRVWSTAPAREIFGLSAEDAGDYRRWLDRVHPDDAPMLNREMQQSLERGTECIVEFRVCAGGQEPRWVLVHGRADPGGRHVPVRIRGVMRDISEQRHVLRETQELRRELAHAGRVSLGGQLASSLAHELSQPLGAILRNSEAAASMLQAPILDREELQAIISDIRRDDSRAGQVIDRLRALLKHRRLDLQPIAVQEVVRDVLELVRTDAVARHVQIESALEPALPAVSGDRVHLSQVLLNLVINAMDAVSDLTPERRRVIVGAGRGNDGTLELHVTDFGGGVRPEAMSRIFEPFFTTKDAGMGMGLAISRALVETHGGRISVRNEPGGGARFTVTLPVAGGSA
jgi:two-component system sensor kinase FixL